MNSVVISPKESVTMDFVENVDEGVKDVKEGVFKDVDKRVVKDFNEKVDEEIDGPFEAAKAPTLLRCWMTASGAGIYR